MALSGRVTLVLLAIAAALLLPALCRAQDCGTWKYGSVPSTGELRPPDLTAVAWAGEHFAASASSQGAAYTSPDGLGWAAATHPPDGPVMGMAWTGSQLVAVGSQGGAYTSPTGDIWTKRTVPASAATTDFSSVAWSGTTLVAVGAQTALVSTDGVTWAAAPVPGLGASNLGSVTWGKDRFVAVGGLFVASSSDGTNWTVTQVLGGPETMLSNQLNGIAWSGIRFVAVGWSCFCHIGAGSAVVLTSGDGITWSSSDTNPFDRMAPGNIFSTGFGFYATAGGGAVFTSLDGLSWTREAQFVGTANAVAASATQVVAAGRGGMTAQKKQIDCTAPPPVGQTDVTNATIATAAHTSGLASTQWATDAELFNPATSDTTALLYYLPRSTDNSIATRRGVTVPAGKAVRLSDVVGQLFGLSQSAGALIVSSSTSLLVTSRTATNSLYGTFGQFVPGLPEGAALVTGQEGRLIQLSENASYRTNVGFTSISALPITVNVALYRASGERLATVPVALPAFGSTQVTEILRKLGVASVDDAFAVVRSDTPGAKYYAYASVVDNVSSDPLTVLPALASNSEPLYVPAVAHNPGLYGTMWRTDLEVHNPGALQATYRIELLKSGQDNSAPPSVTFTLDPGASSRYSDVVANVFGFQGSSALRITPTAGFVMATARSFTDTGNGSRGQFIPARPLSQATTPPSTARLIQLSHAPTDLQYLFRTNIGFVNATGSPITVQTDLFMADGTPLGSHVDTLAPYEFRQDTKIFETVTSNYVDDGFAVITSSTPDARFFAYASVIDNVSGAPVYVPAL
ncbi:MAG: WD40/YVTN/BNR-like repeat-containing protein [Thermoanaerobaculales bacterium]